MPRRTNSDLIIEVREAIASLATRADKAEEKLVRIDIESIRERIARVELLLSQLIEARQESRGRSSLLIVSITSAIVGAATTFLLQRYTAE